ncbi:MAG: hypothetical protein AAFW87_04560 [Pseudomonadota bacterium]
MAGRIAWALAAGLSIAGLAQAAAQTVPLGDDPKLGGGKFDIGGGITVAVEPRRAVDGQMAICGIWAESERLSAYVRQYSRDVLAPGTLAVNGQVVRHDLRVFNQVKPAKSYAGAEATCVATGLPWQQGANIEVRIPRRVVVRERDSDGPGRDIWFLPSDDANPALGSGSILPSRWTRF